MSGAALYPDGEYQHGSTWVNANDRVEWQRTFAVGDAAARKMALAMLTANPDTPADEIRNNLTAPYPSDRYGDMKVSPTIDDVLGTGPAGWKSPGNHLYDRAPTDFSGSPAGQEASSLPSLDAS